MSLLSTSAASKVARRSPEVDSDNRWKEIQPADSAGLHKDFAPAMHALGHEPCSDLAGVVLDSQRQGSAESASARSTGSTCRAPLADTLEQPWRNLGDTKVDGGRCNTSDTSTLPTQSRRPPTSPLTYFKPTLEQDTPSQPLYQDPSLQSHLPSYGTVEPLFSPEGPYLHPTSAPLPNSNYPFTYHNPKFHQGTQLYSAQPPAISSHHVNYPPSSSTRQPSYSVSSYSQTPVDYMLRPLVEDGNTNISASHNGPSHRQWWHSGSGLMAMGMSGYYDPHQQQHVRSSVPSHDSWSSGNQRNQHQTSSLRYSLLAQYHPTPLDTLPSLLERHEKDSETTTDSENFGEKRMQEVAEAEKSVTLEEREATMVFEREEEDTRRRDKKRKEKEERREEKAKEAARRKEEVLTRWLIEEEARIVQAREDARREDTRREELRREEAELRWREDEIRRKEEDLQRKLMEDKEKEIKRLQYEARSKEANIKLREWEARFREEEAKKKEVEIQERERQLRLAEEREIERKQRNKMTPLSSSSSRSSTPSSSTSTRISRASSRTSSCASQVSSPLAAGSTTSKSRSRLPVSSSLAKEQWRRRHEKLYLQEKARLELEHIAISIQSDDDDVTVFEEDVDSEIPDEKCKGNDIPRVEEETAKDHQESVRGRNLEQIGAEGSCTEERKDTEVEKQEELRKFEEGLLQRIQEEVTAQYEDERQRLENGWVNLRLLDDEFQERKESLRLAEEAFKHREMAAKEHALLLETQKLRAAQEEQAKVVKEGQAALDRRKQEVEETEAKVKREMRNLLNEGARLEQLRREIATRGEELKEEEARLREREVRIRTKEEELMRRWQDLLPGTTYQECVFISAQGEVHNNKSYDQSMNHDFNNTVAVYANTVNENFDRRRHSA